MPSSHISTQLPVLDLSKPISPSSLSTLSLACKEWGFFHIINHGISKDLYSKLRSLSCQLFSLPCELKLKAGPTSNTKTYTPHFIASPFFESLRVSGPDFGASAQSSVEAVSSDPDSEFCEVVREYGDKMRILSKKITQIILMCLGKDFNTKFKSEFSTCEGYLRINNYSLPEKRVPGKDVEGLGMHTDMSCLTIVYQDDIGGLQVRSKDGKWLNIDPFEGSLVVNIGDLLHAWSNGKLRSSEHRVVLKECRNQNQNRSRVSLAFFWCFEDKKVISAPDEVVSDELRCYKPFKCGDYLKFRENSERGKFEKVGFTVKDFAGI
ncbi:gibberellin 20-oxidase-like protein [Bidens hawaiensis]|uniref:gibberellin 20-oxidase-like protein n=1 Tax=Bidens hawaiensis TaxID=980011 RepID=UPI00404AC5A8